MGLKEFFKGIEPQFEKGGKYEKWYALLKQHTQYFIHRVM